MSLWKFDIEPQKYCAMDDIRPGFDELVSPELVAAFITMRHMAAIKDVKFMNDLNFGNAHLAMIEGITLDPLTPNTYSEAQKMPSEWTRADSIAYLRGRPSLANSLAIFAKGCCGHKQGYNAYYYRTVLEFPILLFAKFDKTYTRIVREALIWCLHL